MVHTLKTPFLTVDIIIRFQGGSFSSSGKPSGGMGTAGEDLSTSVSPWKKQR